MNDDFGFFISQFQAKRRHQVDHERIIGRYNAGIAFVIGVGVGAMLMLLISATKADAAVNSPCQVTGHLVAEPGHVTAVFTVAETCREVSLLSWLAPDAHAGNPQVLYDRRSQSDVAPGDYRWTITAPPPGCFYQLDLRVPGHNVDALLGGTRLCTKPPPPSTTTTTTLSTTTTEEATTTTTTASSTPSTTSMSATTPTTTPLVSGEAELPHSGNGDLRAMTVAALGLIGAGCWVELRGRARRRRL